MVGFTPAEEVERTLVEAVEKVEKVVWDFFKEGLVEEVDSTLLMVGLVEEVGLLVEISRVGQGEEEEGTLVEAVGVTIMIPVRVVVDPSTLETISRMNVVTIPRVMVT